jgi:PLP dependent protein
VQEWRALRDTLAEPDLAWHMVGHLQRNKVRYCRPFELIHSLDSERLARALEAEGAKHEHRFRVLLQVDLTRQAARHGVAPADAPALLATLRRLPHVHVEGLMTMAPFDPDAERARPVFRELRALARSLDLPELSMGMSNDFEVAIEEGATLVRVGTALFAAAAARASRARASVRS